MSDELESILTESLQQRATQAKVHRYGFGDVRRRVRRHRQRQMAAGLLPAVAGFGFIVTRQVAHDPLSPGGGAGCDTPQSTTSWLDGSPGSSTVAPPPWTGEPTTLPMDAPYVTDAKGRVYYLDANGNVVLDANGNPATTLVYDPARDGTTTTTYPLSTLPPIGVDASGNPVGTTIPAQGVWIVVEGDSLASIAYRFGVTVDELVAANAEALSARPGIVPGDRLTIPWSSSTDPNAYTTDPNGNVVATSTTIACEVPTTDPLATDPADTTPVAAGDSTTSTSVELQDYSFVMFANASTVNGAASAYAQQFPGAQRTNGSTKVQTSYVMASVGSEGAAESIASQLGIADVRVGIDTSAILDQVDMTAIKVVVVIGEGHALALTAPTTTAPQSTTSSIG